ncbi:MAG TPA: hypothetical protein VKU77_26990 [Streptosporangiaceae bacterium]|nr:hypothetical protein [Streptosporangiaceae bacterium]
MRHLIGVALAIVMAAAVFFAASWGYFKLLGASAGAGLPGGGGTLIHDHAVLEGLGALLAVGLLAGLLMALPVISPLAAGLPGLALLAWTGLYLFNVRRAVLYIPLKSQTYGVGFQTLLYDGVLALVGLAMIIPLFVPSRWRSRAVAAAPAPFEPVPPDAYPELGATQTIAGDGLLTDWAETRPQPRVDPGRSQAPWGPVEPGGSGGSPG